MDLATILRAIQIVGATSAAGRQLFEGFLAVVSEKDQLALRRRYAEERVRSADLHDQVQAALQ